MTVNYICPIKSIILTTITRLNTDTILFITIPLCVYVIVKSICVTVFRPKGASEARARGLLMVKTMNTYTLNSLVSDLFCDRQRM